MSKLILRCSCSLGDVVLLTAAVRDLHRAHPGLFATDVRTPFPELWQHNPYLTPLHDYDPDVTIIECWQPLIKASNVVGSHAIHGFMDFLNRTLSTRVHPTALAGDIYLSPAERRARSSVAQLTGRAIPFWLISTGGKL